MKLRTLLAIFLVVALLAAGVGCAAEEKVIYIGAIGPTTGESSIGGIDEFNGKTMAIEDFNATGGWNGNKFVLVAEDDASQPSQSAAAATKLINQNKVVAIVGAHNSSCTLADMEVISKYKIPMITPGSSAVAIIANGNPWMTRAFPGDAIQCAAVINYAVKEKGLKKLGVIYINDDVGHSGLNVATTLCEKNNIEICSETFQADDKDYKTQLMKLRDQNVDGLLIWCQYVPGSLIMKQAREMGWDVQYYSGTCTTHNETFNLSNGTYAGIISGIPFIPNSTEPKIVEWVGRYQTRFSKLPSQNSARAYDATMILLNAIKAANTIDAEKLQAAIRSTKDFDGLQGKITIVPETGEYQGDVMIVTVTAEGKFEQIGSASSGS